MEFKEHRLTVSVSVGSKAGFATSCHDCSACFFISEKGITLPFFRIMGAISDIGRFLDTEQVFRR